MADFETIIYEKKDNIAWVILNRPHVLNAYSMKMRDDLYQVLGAIKDDNEVRVTVLSGAGQKAFCAGADLREFLTAPSPSIARRVRWERDIWGLFISLPQPMVAAVHGYVLGSGIEIALCCDIRIASEEAQFCMPETGLGIIPAAGATQTLPRTIGRNRALETMLAGRRIDAQEALEIGLVNRVVPNTQLHSTAERMAGQIAGFYPAAIRSAKQAVIRGLDLGLREGLELEKRVVSSLIQSKAGSSCD